VVADGCFDHWNDLTGLVVVSIPVPNDLESIDYNSVAVMVISPAFLLFGLS
jgi:hypothetical protein